MLLALVNLVTTAERSWSTGRGRNSQTRSNDVPDPGSACHKCRMSAVTQYVYDGRRWRNEVTTTSQTVVTTSAAPVAGSFLNLWKPWQYQDSITGQGEAFELYKAQPCFQWLGEWTTSPRSDLAGYVASAAGRVIPLCVYGFPRYGYSAGGVNDISSYRSWINEISAGLGSAPCILVLEPDALGLHTNMSDGTTPETALAYAVSRFKAYNPQTAVYLDASHWIDPSVQSQRLRGANISNAAGFATNVSNFRGTPEQVAYCESVTARLAQDGVPGKRYVIDTGRNGKGELTSAFGPAAAPWLSRSEEWLNPPGRGLGLSPRGNPDPMRPSFVAALWIKPPGASDGNNPGSTWSSDYFPDKAPGAGQFWLSWMKDCLAHTDMANLSLSGSTAPPAAAPPSTPKIASLKDDFSVAGSTPWGAGGYGYSVRNGSLTLPAGPTYPTIRSAKRYDLTESQIVVRCLRVPNLTRSTQTWLALAAPTGDNTLQIFWENGILRCREVVNGSATGTSLAFSLSAHAWWRIRNAAGVTYWETSSNKTTWAVRHRATARIPITSLQVRLTAGNWGSETAPGSAIYDTVNA